MPQYKNKLFSCSLIIGSLFLLLFFRLFYLQILRGDEFELFSIENHIRLINSPAPRGKILDRRSKDIVVNRPSFDLKVFPNELKNIRKVTEMLSRIIDMDSVEIEEAILKAKKRNAYLPFILIKDIERDTLAVIEANKPALNGISIEVNYLRDYPEGKLGSLFVGYLGKPNKNDLKKFPLTNLDIYVGKTGIEETFENHLRGSNGTNYKVIDALGREVKSKLFQKNIEGKETLQGNDIYLTIDIDLQKKSEELLNDKVGSIIVVNVNTGEVLALASNPSFDPVLFVNGISQSDWNELTKNIFHPMLNRATLGIYAPGSTFKIVTALSALKENIIDEETTFFCPGYYKVGKKKFKCWKHSGHGWVNLHSAISQSCDVFFYNIAEKLGIDRLSKYAKIFGFGSKTGIETNEKEGLVPNRLWKYKNYKEPWYKGETVITAIGQGYLNVTPLQITMMTAAVANGGSILKPILIKKITDLQGNNKMVNKSEILRILPFDDIQIKMVQDSLVSAVNGKFGTGKRARVKHGTVAGKTGTAQVISSKTKSKKIIHKDHAWFTAYYPAENPEIAVTVLIENGGGGGSVAAPLAKEIIDEFYRRKYGIIQNDNV